MRLDCCNFDVGQSDGHSLKRLGMGEAHKTKSSMGSGSGETAQIPPLGGNFTLSGARLWIMCSPLVESPRDQSGGALGVVGSRRLLAVRPKITWDGL